MGTILDQIIKVKMQEVERLKQIKRLKGEPRKKQSFIKRLAQAEFVSIIAEFKRASPSKGMINGDLNPKTQAMNYVQGGADAISVLTDNQFFKGSFEDLKQVRAGVVTPVLCKDFIVDPIQIDVAEDSGADVILLIAAALDDEKLHQLHEYALSKDLEVLIEVHNEEEAKRALRTGNSLIGVNNRNLKTFEVDLGITERLAPMIKSAGRYLISESGMKTKEDVERVVRVGANGILVGETFMKHPNLQQAFLEMKIPFKEVTSK